MAENNAELQVRDFFEVHGFHIERIPEIEGEKRADYLANDSRASYLIEVKGRIEDNKYIKRLLEQGLASKEEELGRTNPISKQIREAAEQLRSESVSPEAFRIVSLVASCLRK